MSVFDLFRGFFGVPGGQYRGDHRDPFFGGMIHDENDDEDEDEDDGELHHEDFNRRHRGPLDDAFRFGFSFGPGRMRFEEPQMFGQIFRDMEEIFAGLGRFDEHYGFGERGVPSIGPSPAQDGEEKKQSGSGSGNPIRDFMLKFPDSSPLYPSVTPKDKDYSPGEPSRPSSHWKPFSRFDDLWKDGQFKSKQEKKEDGDLDSQVSAGGLDQILRPEPSAPKTRLFFKSVSITKVVRPDGTVEEQRTVRDGDGNEETTVTVSGAAGEQRGREQSGSIIPGGIGMQDDLSLFSKFFGGFRR